MRGYLDTIKLNPAIGGPGQSEHGKRDGSLPAARFTNHGNHLLLADAEGYVVYSEDLAVLTVAFAQVGDVQQVGHRYSLTGYVAVERGWRQA